jgi:hypothetical protein
MVSQVRKNRATLVLGRYAQLLKLGAPNVEGSKERKQAQTRADEADGVAGEGQTDGGTKCLEPRLEPRLKLVADIATTTGVAPRLVEKYIEGFHEGWNRRGRKANGKANRKATSALSPFHGVALKTDSLCKMSGAWAKTYLSPP